MIEPSEPSDAPPDVAGSLLAELAAGGDLVDEGGFSIDAGKALDKLRGFALADPHAYVLLLIEAAVLGGADPIEIELGAGVVSIELGPIEFSREELEQLFAAVFIDLSDADPVERRRRRALQKLAFACNAALSLEPKQIEIESGGQGSEGLHVRLSPEQKLGELESRKLVAGARVRVHHGAIASLAQVQSPEEALIRSHCAYSPAAIFIGDERISQGLRFALHVQLVPDELRFSPQVRKRTRITLDGAPIGLAGLRYSGNQPAVVSILTNGVLAERFELGSASRRAAPDFGAIVDVDLPKDLGQAKLLRGPEFTRVLDAIWAVHDKIAPAKFGDATGVASDQPAERSHEGIYLPMLILGIGTVLTMFGFGSGGWLMTLGLATAALGVVILLFRIPRN
ncbi:hypothetical protein [Enhygromyxa salina]|uniref:hypothetical protein n=1 Tax=Enhygromyxa salina TaxID=215803 RepID=UPI0011B24F68|nr:hypothetical protein [Enhygromyxa salina]